jgi:hypothetical protein
MGAEGLSMQIDARVIPMAGISEVPAVADDIENAEARRQRAELFLLNVATGLAVLLISCAWIALALD